MVAINAPADLLVARTGLYIPPERTAHLDYCIRAAIRDGGFSDLESFLTSLRDNAPLHPAWQYLIRHLAIGETYFFRDADVLQNNILPALLERKRAENSQSLRIWSVGCATGEEPYTIAMLLREQLADIANWKISIVGTDLNLQALSMARRGQYGKWSLRGSPEGHPDLQLRGNRWQITEAVRAMVEFRYLNLIDDRIAIYDADLIVCRNVLMYLERTIQATVLERLKTALGKDGELLLDNTARGVPGSAAPKRNYDVVPPRRLPRPAQEGAKPKGWDDPIAMARDAANRANWSEAHRWLDQAETKNRLDLQVHYLRALIYDSQGRTADAISTLRRCLYLDHNFALGYFTLGNLHAQRGEESLARQHWSNAVALLELQPPDQVLLLSDGMTVSDILMVIRAQLAERQ